MSNLTIKDIEKAMELMPKEPISTRFMASADVFAHIKNNLLGELDAIYDLENNTIRLKHCTIKESMVLPIGVIVDLDKMDREIEIL